MKQGIIQLETKYLKIDNSICSIDVIGTVNDYKTVLTSRVKYIKDKTATIFDNSINIKKTSFYPICNRLRRGIFYLGLGELGMMELYIDIISKDYKKYGFTTSIDLANKNPYNHINYSVRRYTIRTKDIIFPMFITCNPSFIPNSSQKYIITISGKDRYMDINKSVSNILFRKVQPAIDELIKIDKNMNYPINLDYSQYEVSVDEKGRIYIHDINIPGLPFYYRLSILYSGSKIFIDKNYKYLTTSNNTKNPSPIISSYMLTNNVSMQQYYRIENRKELNNYINVLDKDVDIYCFSPLGLFSSNFSSILYFKINSNEYK